MTCGDAPNCTWTDLAMPTLAGGNCAKHWEEFLIVTIEDSMKKKSGSLSFVDSLEIYTLTLRLADLCMCSHCKFTRLSIADRTLVHDRSSFAT